MTKGSPAPSRPHRSPGSPQDIADGGPLRGLTAPWAEGSTRALMTDANAELGSYAITTSGKPDAVCQGFKETALDKANNSETVGGAGIIDVACPAVNNPCPTPPSP